MGRGGDSSRMYREESSGHSLLPRARARAPMCPHGELRGFSYSSTLSTVRRWAAEDISPAGKIFAGTSTCTAGAVALSRRSARQFVQEPGGGDGDIFQHGRQGTVRATAELRPRTYGLGWRLECRVGDDIRGSVARKKTCTTGAHAVRVPAGPS
jgi:hypothetical protein